MYSPKEVAVNYIDVAAKKVNNAWYKTFVLAVLAGMFIALAGALSTVVGTTRVGVEANLMRAAVFPVGLILVVVCGSELFTGNCLLLAPVLSGAVRTRDMLKNLGIVYLGNLVGSFVVALIVVSSDALPHGAVVASVNIVATKSDAGFLATLVRGIGCNVLVCLAVWGSMAAKNVSSKTLFVYLPIFAFVALGFEHSVANMYYVSAGFIANGVYKLGYSLSFGKALLNNLLPSTIGNVIGGMAFVAIPYWIAYLCGERTDD